LRARDCRKTADGARGPGVRTYRAAAAGRPMVRANLRARQAGSGGRGLSVRTGQGKLKASGQHKRMIHSQAFRPGSVRTLRPGRSGPDRNRAHPDSTTHLLVSHQEMTDDCPHCARRGPEPARPGLLRPTTSLGPAWFTRTFDLPGYTHHPGRLPHQRLLRHYAIQHPGRRPDKRKTTLVLPSA
jgi:hypothetical protein